MRTLLEYILNEEEAATPANTMGMGDPGILQEPVSIPRGEPAPVGGIPKEKIRIHRRRKRSKPGKRDFEMIGDKHNT